jgi:hypothetical protein
MKLSKEACLELGKTYIQKHNKYPVSKKWTIATAGCGNSQIYKYWGSWPLFIADLRTIIDIGEYKASTWNKGLTTSTTFMEDRYCINCNKKFNSYSKNKKYCSRECSYTNPNLGGIREGSGRSKTGYCDGIYCGSTYELAWVIYNLDNDIDFTRCDKVFIYGNKKYYPDFIQDNKIIEIKGYWTEEVELKKQAVIDAGFDIQILYREDLKHCFDWIKNEYEVPIETLFDAYSPKFTYTCSHCNTSFTTDRKKSTNTVYCSRSCSGHGVHK